MSDAPTAGFPPANWRKHLWLFLATLASVFFAGAMYDAPPPPEGASSGEALWHLLTHIYTGWAFAVPLMLILLTHEFGHYFAALKHKVPASLPYFIPLPILSPFGTMGAVISMPKRIQSRNALMDIGAAGPLAGLVVAIPVLIIGLMQSQVKPLVPGGSLEGQCLLYWLLKHMVFGEIPAGHDVFLSSTAFAGWTGLLVTSLNLLPIGQLDGGHIAYALFDKKQLRIAPVLHWGLLAAFVYNYARYQLWAPGMVWLLWFVLLHGFKRFSGGEHPPTESGPLTRGRKLIGALCLVLFVLLFMPTPMYIPLQVGTLTPAFEAALQAVKL